MPRPKALHHPNLQPRLAMQAFLPQLEIGLTAVSQTVKQSINVPHASSA